MTTETSHREEATGRAVLDVEHAREVGPTEAAGLLRECLAIFHKRFDSALWRALETLVSGAPDAGDATFPTSPGQRPEARIADAVRRERDRFIAGFRSEFDQLFQARRRGTPRVREARASESFTLELVGDRDLKDQVALKSAVRAMTEATHQGDIGFDLRVGIIMRDASTADELDNPWSADYVCDALGTTARALWTSEQLWRPIMLHLVKALTPELASLHRELNKFLQERDILPVLRVRTRARGGAVMAPADGASALYDKLIAMLGSGAVGRRAAGTPAQHLTAGADRGTSFPAINSWMTLIQALTLLERGQVRVPGLAALPEADVAALRNGTANELPVLQAAMVPNDESPLDQVTIEILSAVLDEVFDNPYLPAEIKTIFGRLQISMLKAALIDQGVLSQPRHCVRRYFDTLAAASIGVRAGNAQDAQFVRLASELAQHIRDDFTDDLKVFEKARSELEGFLDAERAAYNEKLAQALPSLIALDQHAAAMASARTALALRVAGRDVPKEIREFLDHEALGRLTSAYQADGADGAAWKEALQRIDDLLWSIAPDAKPGARKRLLQLVPRLVRALDDGWPNDDASHERRAAFLARLYELHVAAMRSPAGPPSAAELRPVPRPGVPAPPSATSRDSGDDVVGVDALMRGDWCVFADEKTGAPVLARFGWLAPNGTQLLFTHRDGSIAFVYTPQALARDFHSKAAQLAVEAIPLFERAMERLLTRRAAGSEAAMALR
ncbi:MAG: DUF1631 family protein [Casimicrobiaceae bacterium]